MNQHDLFDYLEARIRERAAIACLHVKRVQPPGQLTMVAFDLTATGDGSEPYPDSWYFRVSLAFDSREFDWSNPDTPARLVDVLSIRWSCSMIAMWEVIQGESGNKYRNEVKMMDREFKEQVAAAASKG